VTHTGLAGARGTARTLLDAHPITGRGEDARRARSGTLPPEMGTRAGVPAEREATARARLPSGRAPDGQGGERPDPQSTRGTPDRSEEHTSELQSRGHLVCRLLLEK